MKDWNSLTKEEKQVLRAQMQAEEKEKANKIKEERDAYKELVNSTVIRNFERLEEASQYLAKVKAEVYEDFQEILRLKAEIYGIAEKQKSHTFTADDGKSIVIGHRTRDAFDDTVHAGIEKIKKCLSQVVSGEQTVVLEILDTLLKKDKNGNMRANRVLELERLSEKLNMEDFTEGVSIIKEAYKPIKSSTFIECYYKTEEGNTKSVPLTMTGV